MVVFNLLKRKTEEKIFVPIRYKPGQPLPPKWSRTKVYPAFVTQ